MDIDIKVGQICADTCTCDEATCVVTKAVSSQYSCHNIHVSDCVRCMVIEEAMHHALLLSCSLYMDL